MTTEQLSRYGPLSEIRTNLRFATYRGTLDEQPVFIKVAATDAMKQKLLLEAVGLKNMKELDSAEQFYRVPTVLEIAPDHIVTTWAEGIAMSSTFAGNNPNLSNYLHYLSELFVFIDSRTRGSGVTRYNQPGKENGVDATLRKLESVHAADHIDPSLLHAIAQYVRVSLKRAETRFTNGDLQPGNLLVDTNQNVTVIDCESCSWLWPRHYNTVNFIFNYGAKSLWLRPQLAHFFRDYCHKTQVSESEVDAFNLSAAIRCLHLVYEELGAYLEAKPTDTPLDPEIKMYIENTMQRILNGNLFLETN